MKILTKELGNNTWLKYELLSSIDHKLIEKISINKEFEVKILIDGVEHEPVILQKIFDNITSYIENEGKKIAANKYIEAFEEVERFKEDLTNVVTQFKEKIAEKYNINIDDYDD